MAMPNTDAQLLDGPVLLALIPLGLVLLGLAGYALYRVWRAERVPYLPRWAWTVLILASMPWGAVVYLLVGGSFGSGSASHAPPAAPTATPQPSAAPTATPPAPQPLAASRNGSSAPDIVPGSAILTTHGLTRDYGGAGLFDVDVTVPQGSVYGLVGPNGAGKTTLLSLVTGLRRADRGSVELGMPREAVAFCPDVPEFEPWLTAYEVVDLSRHYVAPRLGPDAVRRALATAGLADQADRRVAGFSRGMTQRLGLAAAIVGDPRLLILDEPTSALDPAGRAEVLDLVAGMRGHRTVIFSSHILSDVQRVADQVGVLQAGRLLYQGATRSLVDRYLNPRWVLRLATNGAEVAERLRQQPWARRVDLVDAEQVRVETDTLEHGEIGICQVVSACQARMTSFEPLAADLESAFLAMTGTASEAHV